jgi:hypothetical protein
MKWCACVAVMAVLSGCVSLEEQKTARVVFCADSLAPIAIVGGERVSGFDIVTALRDRKPDRVVIMAESGAAPLLVTAMAELVKLDRGEKGGVTVAETEAERAQAKRLCASR